MSKNDPKDIHNPVKQPCFSENAQTNVKLLKRWIDAIEKQCDTDPNPDLYLACAQALHANCDMLLCRGLDWDSKFEEGEKTNCFSFGS